MEIVLSGKEHIEVWGCLRCGQEFYPGGVNEGDLPDSGRTRASLTLMDRKVLRGRDSYTYPYNRARGIRDAQSAKKNQR